MLTRIIISTLVFCTLSTLDIQGQDCTVEKSPFNSKESDFSPSYFGEGLVFSSNRAKRILAADEDTLNTYYTDLFYVQLGDKRKRADLFSRELTGWLNEGPCTFNQDETVIYYTGNIEPEKKKKKIHEYKLGIFKAELKDGKWGNISSFEFNRKEKHNLAHPALSTDDQLMVFTSNLPGGKGATDLYCSVWNGESWEKPENIGPNVNTKSNEMFPWLDEYKNLYFSSDRKDGLGGMDVYCSKYNKGNWETPEALSMPINSEFDDFAYVHTLGGKKGHFSSNRLDSIDNIFDFTWSDPVFDNCDENRQSIYCYLIEEIELPGADTLPFIYQWDMGDGTIEEGLSVQHCFPGIGDYDIVLNAIDTTTQQMFLRISEVSLTIDSYDQPYITSPSIIKPNEEQEFSALESSVSSYEPDLYYWDFGDGELHFGPTVKHSFDEIGTYRILLGASGRPNEDGIRQKKCTYKTIVVSNEETQLKNEIHRDIEGKQYKKLEMKPAREIEGIMADAVLVNAYRVVLLSSKKQISVDDEMFSSIGEDVILEYDDESERYIYTTGLIDNLSDTYELYNDLEKSDFKGAKVYTVGLIDHQASIDKFNQADTLSYTFKIDEPLFVQLENNSMMVDTNGEFYSDFLSSYNITEIDFGDGTIMKDSFSEHRFVLPGIYSAKMKMVSNDDVHQYEYERSVEIIIEDIVLPVLADEINSDELLTTEVIEESIIDSSEDLSLRATQEELNHVLEENNETLKDDIALHSEIVDISSDEVQTEIESGDYIDDEEIQSEAIISNDIQSDEIIDEDLMTDGIDLDINQTEEVDQTTMEDVVVLDEAVPADALETEMSLAKSEIVEAENVEESVEQDLSLSKEGIQKMEPVVAYQHLVQFADSEQRIPFNDPLFTDVEDEILEIKKESQDGYSYCVGPFENIELAQVAASTIQSIGFSGNLIQMELGQIENKLVKRGYYIPKGDAASLNYEFTGLTDIQFEYNSSEIKEESFGNLDYIVAMLGLESDFILRIQAHTCNIGGSDFNLSLSDKRANSVLEYIAENGIDVSRFRPTGYGDSRPKESNSTEQGRIRNRRVEFTIVFAPEVTDLSMVK